MSFADKSFKERFGDEMWNHSERHFESVWPYSFSRFGLNKDDDDLDTWKLDPFLRHAPDYLGQVVPRGPLFFVEVQGTGKGGGDLHKFKQQKLDVLGQWNRYQDVVFWLWDDRNQQGTAISYNTVRLLIARGEASRGMFDGKRPWWGLTVQQIVAASDWEQLESRYRVTT